jgi:hypothetical protein
MPLFEIGGRNCQVFSSGGTLHSHMSIFTNAYFLGYFWVVVVKKCSIFTRLLYTQRLYIKL